MDCGIKQLDRIDKESVWVYEFEENLQPKYTIITEE